MCDQLKVNQCEGLLESYPQIMPPLRKILTEILGIKYFHSKLQYPMHMYYKHRVKIQRHTYQSVQPHTFRSQVPTISSTKQCHHKIVIHTYTHFRMYTQQYSKLHTVPMQALCMYQMTTHTHIRITFPYAHTYRHTESNHYTTS